METGKARVTAQAAKEAAAACGFELAGIAPALPLDDYERFDEWRGAGFAGEMSYLTDRRGDLRADPRNLLPSAQSILCVGKLYNTRAPYSAEPVDGEQGWIARYAWGEDYHDGMRKSLEEVVCRLRRLSDKPFEWRICVDTAPLLERSLARLAGLGWIGKNTCLINQEKGSWFLLGEVILSLALSPEVPPEDRCGTCRRCIDACPTTALIPDDDGRMQLDSRLCISYLTIEKRGGIEPAMEGAMGRQIFGCDICQDVCPWNTRAAVSDGSPLETQFLAELANLGEAEFRQKFRSTPVWRAKYQGFLRNVAVAMGNSKSGKMLAPLATLMGHDDCVIAETAARSYTRLTRHLGELRE